MKLKILFLILFLLPTFVFANNTRRCVYINSYHEGFVWSDTISRVITDELKNSCEVISFNMDTKRNKNIDFIKAQALKAKNLIEKVKPDIVLTSDDNAAKFLIVPYFKDSKIPFIFSGVNWTAEKYGFPFKNVTGMIEVNPIKPLYKLAFSLTYGKKVIFIGDDTLTDKKDLSFFKKYAQKEGFILDSLLANNVKEWKNAYLNAQDTHDFIILGHNSAIKDWDDENIKNFVLKNSKKLVLATYSWMMPYSMIGLIIKPQEHGKWVSQSAKAVLDGYPIESIAITTNKTWTTFINQQLLEAANITLPRSIKIKSNIYDVDKY